MGTERATSRSARPRTRRLRRPVVGLVTLIVSALVLTACGGAASSGPTGPVDTEALQVAQAAVARFAGPQDGYTGPTTSPQPTSGKRIAFVTSSASLPLLVDTQTVFEEVAGELGWTVTGIDGQGSVSGWLAGLNQAISLRPDGIVVAAITPDAVPEPFARARELGIPVVGVYSSGSSGPEADPALAYNEGQDAEAVGEALAQMAVADSGGTARVVLVYDNAYAIARGKNEGMQRVIEACSSCTLLENVSTPFGSLASNMPGLAAGWLGKYGSEPFYVLSVGDVAFDSRVPMLRSRNVAQDRVKLIASDGSATAYERIRTGQYQIATVPQPVGQLAYDAADQLNRAFSDAPFGTYVPDPYLVTAANIDANGGAQGVFEPANDYRARYAQAWGIG